MASKDPVWCDICHMTLEDLQMLVGRSPESRRLVVDHDHATGAIRGLLCDLCNGWLAVAEDQEAGHPTAGRKSAGYKKWRGYHATRIKAFLGQASPYDYSERDEYWAYRLSGVAAI